MSVVFIFEIKKRQKQNYWFFKGQFLGNAWPNEYDMERLLISIT